jgi:hypothetical protein
VRWSALLIGVTLASLELVVAPTVARADDACPDSLQSTTHLPDQLTPETSWFAAPTGHTQSFTVSTSWSNDSSLSGNFTLVHDRIQVGWGISISHTYTRSETDTFFIPAHKEGRIRSRWEVWTNKISQRNWNGRTCNPPQTVTKTAKHFVRFEAQIRACNPPC